MNVVIWDFDGTLVDSGPKNLRVTRAIIEFVTGRPADDFAALRSLEAYRATDGRIANWRQLYREEFGLSAKETDRAGRLWSPYQLRDNTPTPLFGGIPHVLETLAPLPQGIVSQNSKENILATLRANDLAHHFRAIIGYEEVGFHDQKPQPDGLLHCLEILAGGDAGRVFYIGDHETDAVCAANAREVLTRKGSQTQLVAIGAFHGRREAPPWAERLDHIAWRTSDIITIIQDQLKK